ncbi:hypothetical protein [Tropicibacter naphthalenivorans]|uniref:Uncharacterized protein n=1 Tax=Tropicibacter naphthalenivorans TaxID=441103 RepID=A0A0P1H2B9_9RHOB|nr:hypothetical protein [Tropicibacter naphthalenivorans]CUH81413.1 hypothetical protein TRN7648_03455 [Tropicibacter naphthalenivorans]SMD00536.1 hypothetical protein SAMN04488093_109135 [Tropicibacter naphthalenivorans]
MTSPASLRRTARLSWRWHASRLLIPGNLWLLVIVGVVSAVGFVIFLMLLRQAPPYAVMQLRSTFLEQIVEREALAKMKLPVGPWLNAAGDPCLLSISERGSESTVEVHPRAGIRLRYRWRPGRLAILLSDAPAGLPVADLARDDIGCAVANRLVINLELPVSDGLLVLPVAGPAEVGAENVGQDHFFGGEIYLSARALLPPDRGALYPASDAPIVLPEGGRLAAADELRAGQSWYGTARVTSDGLVIAANTETATLVLVRAGDRSEFEPLHVGLLAKLFQDPSVAPWSIGTLFVITVLQLAISALSLSPGKRKESKPSASAPARDRNEKAQGAAPPVGTPSEGAD